MASKKSKFSQDKAAKKELMKKYGKHENDSGSPMVQIAILSQKISHLTDHLKDHRGDKHSRRGLLSLVGQRRRLVTYMQASEEYPEADMKKFLREMGL